MDYELILSDNTSPDGAQGYYDLTPKELLSLNEAALDQALLKRRLQFIEDDPARFLLLSIGRFREFFKFWPSPESGLISNISRVGSFGFSIPFILYGLWFALISDWKTRTIYERRGIVLLILFVIVYTTIHLFSWVLIRYRLPVDALLLIFAAFGSENLVRKYLPSVRLG